MSDAPTLTLADPITRIYDWVEVTVPGVLHPVVQAAVFSALEEFCSRSTYWRVYAQWEMDAGVDTIDFNNPPPDPSMRVRWVLDVCGINKVLLQPTAILIDKGDTDEARSGTATLVCVPTKLAVTLPDWFDDWSEQIQAGVLARLYMMPAKPYSNLQLGQLYGRQFRAGIQLARVEAGRMVNRQSVVFPYFARGRQGSGLVGTCCGGAATGGSPKPPDPPDPTPDSPLVSISNGVISDAVIPPDPTPGDGPMVAVSDATISDAPSAPSVDLSTNALTFASTSVGISSPSQTVVVTNSGADSVTITGVTTTGDFALEGMTTQTGTLKTDQG